LPRTGTDPYLPDADDGPITTAVEIEVAPENHGDIVKSCVREAGASLFNNS
jgi:hypothetical protein